MSIATATEKLKNERTKAANKNLAEPVIEYLLKRVSDSESFAEEVDQEHKTWEGCAKYIMERAKKALHNKSGALPKEQVFEMAEDYFHLDDTAKAAEEAREKSVRIAKAMKDAEERKKNKKNTEAEVKMSKSDEKRPKNDKNAQTDTENDQKPTENVQMDIFSMFGI